MDGIFNIYKPSGMTSHDVVLKIRRFMPRRTKVGHGGTLDPDARGVLLVCVGKGTRVVEFLMEYEKVYRGEMILGITTATQDASGYILREAEDFEVTTAEIEALFRQFTGEILQVPPMYSALKHEGKKLYDLARAGQVIERKPRRVMIYDLKFLGVARIHPAVPSREGLRKGDRILFEVVTSKGTYIRTLCHDMGESLGCGAHLDNLERVRYGPFTATAAHSLEEVEKAWCEGRLKDFLEPLEAALNHLPAVRVKESAARSVIHGTPLYEVGVLDLPSEIEEGRRVRLYSQGGRLLAIGETFLEEGKVAFRPVKVLSSVI